MPKEIVYDATGVFMQAADGNEYRDGSEPPGAIGQYRRRGVHVGWTRNQHAEVGVASFDISREMPEDGVSVSLDRDGINRLIRALRRARDAAFGADA